MGTRCLNSRVEGVGDHDDALALHDALERDAAAHLGEHRGVLRLARLEQLADPRQTAGDVACLHAFPQQLRDDATRLHLLPLVHVQVGASREEVGGKLVALVVLDGDPRLEGLQGVLGDLLLDLARCPR